MDGKRLAKLLFWGGGDGSKKTVQQRRFKRARSGDMIERQRTIKFAKSVSEQFNDESSKNVAELLSRRVSAFAA